jgi:5-methylcytosine-specific restriction endonuclease McrA
MPIKPKAFKAPWKPERIDFGRRKDNSKFYNSRRWRKVSKARLSKFPTCEMECKTEGIVTEAKVTDHIAGLDNIIRAGRDPYDWNELQSGCHHCHNKKSGRESGKRIK